MKLPTWLRWLPVLLLVYMIAGAFFAQQSAPKPVDMPYSELIQSLEQNPGTISGITVQNGSNVLKVERKDKPAATVTLPGKAGEQQVLDAAAKAHVPVKAVENDGGGLLGLIGTILFNPITLLVIFWLFMSRQQGGMLNKFQKNGSTQFTPTKESKKFTDVAGCNEAKLELMEVVEFLKDPTSFAEMGAKLPRGVLLIGGPGNGKTLLAKAVAGEAGVPFFALSGSQFVEMLVGVGAARARDLFNKARANMPCIIFIDEIDAVGRHRGAGIGGGHDEREQTLNEILVQMDGFTENESIVIMAATNRPDILDPAVTRSGRFDRHIMVDSPDLKGRVDIFAIHTRGRKLAPGVDLKVLAGLTPGFSGADIAAACNEAATVARRRRQDEINRLRDSGATTVTLQAVPKLITMEDFSEGVDRVIMGPARPRVMSEEDRRNTAVHEIGHAGVGHSLKGDPVRKVTIMPRAKALGFTLSLPEGDRLNKTREQLINEIASMMGGRVAQEVILGVTDTGASNDFKQATAVARRMVTEFGMSKLGHISISDEGGSPFLGRAMGGSGGSSNWGPAVLDQVDAEVRKILDEATQRATNVVKAHKDRFEPVVQALLQKETILGDEFVRLWEGA
jgi:cell division protease FtsH